MSNGEISEELMTRFLVGDVTPDERDEVERRFMEDSDLFTALAALDEELLLSYSRGQLPEPRRRQLEASLAASPARRRRLEELTAFTAALAAEHPSKARLPRYLAIAASAVLALLGTWMVLRSTISPRTSMPVERPAPAAGTIVTVFLQPPSTRAASQAQANVFRLPPEARTVTLTMTIAAERLTNPRAALAPVGGPPIETKLDVRAYSRSGGVEVSTDVPARLLASGDYLLTIDAETERGRDEVASRFFSIVP